MKAKKKLGRPSKSDIENRDLRNEPFREVIAAMDKMQPCPFCGCSMGIYYDSRWGFQWHGQHKSCLCPLADNPSGSFGRIEVCIEEWNRREPPWNHNRKKRGRKKKNGQIQNGENILSDG